EELVVPVQREPAQREGGHVRLVEREDEQDHDRRVQEHDDQREERLQEPSAVLREGDVHQPAVTCLGWRKREKTRVRSATTTRRKIASTDPVSQSGKPVSKRSTTWFPYM